MSHWELGSGTTLFECLNKIDSQCKEDTAWRAVSKSKADPTKDDLSAFVLKTQSPAQVNHNNMGKSGKTYNI